MLVANPVLRVCAEREQQEEAMTIGQSLGSSSEKSLDEARGQMLKWAAILAGSDLKFSDGRLNARRL